MKTTRRKFIEQSLKATLVTAVTSPLLVTASRAEVVSSNEALQFKQVALPYGFNALEPYIDAQTMEIHYTKHHTAYLKNVNEAIAAEKVTAASEADLFKKVSGFSAKVRNNAGGVWNHNFFWQVMKPNGGTPSGKIGDAINSSFGSFEKFKEQFTKAGLDRFGSGWAWLVSDQGKLKIGSTPNQDNPLMDASDFKGKPLLGLDVWEHAYYLKYQNKRNEYIANWWNVVNWEEVAKQLP